MNHLASFSSNQIKWKSCVAGAPLGDVLACLVLLLNQHSFIFFTIYKDQIFSQWNLYTLWFCCSVLYTWRRLTCMYNACLSLLCGSSWGLFHCFFFSSLKSINVIAMLGNINKMLFYLKLHVSSLFSLRIHCFSNLSCTHLLYLQHQQHWIP